MIAMLLACVGAGAVGAIPLCWMWQRRRSRAGRLPDLRFERVVSDALLVRGAGGAGGRRDLGGGKGTGGLRRAGVADRPSNAAGAGDPGDPALPRGASTANVAGIRAERTAS